MLFDIVSCPLLQAMNGTCHISLCEHFIVIIILFARNTCTQ